MKVNIKEEGKEGTGQNEEEDVSDNEWTRRREIATVKVSTCSRDM